MCVGLTDVGIVPKIAFLTSLVSYKHSTILLICWICAFVNCDWQSDYGWCIDFIFFSITCLFQYFF